MLRSRDLRLFFPLFFAREADGGNDSHREDSWIGAFPPGWIRGILWRLSKVLGLP